VCMWGGVWSTRIGQSFRKAFHKGFVIEKSCGVGLSTKILQLSLEKSHGARVPVAFFAPIF
jgi:hypothetical protein